MLEVVQDIHKSAMVWPDPIYTPSQHQLDEWNSDIPPLRHMAEDALLDAQDAAVQQLQSHIKSYVKVSKQQKKLWKITEYWLGNLQKAMDN